MGNCCASEFGSDYKSTDGDKKGLASFNVNHKSSSEYGIRDLKLKSNKFYKKELNINKGLDNVEYGNIKTILSTPMYGTNSFSYSFEGIDSYKTYNRLGCYRQDINPGDNIKIYKGTGVLNEKDSVYFGQFADGKPQGVGIAVSKDGDTFKNKEKN